MVIGNGLLAKAFDSYENNDKVLIFASGVSNSTETNLEEFEREFKLLSSAIVNNPRCTIVYFSTVSIGDASVNERPYVLHKIALENYIKMTAKKYLICRISNVVGAKGNANTIMNYLVDAIKQNIKFDIWILAERNLIDVNDVKFIIDELLYKNIVSKTINIATSKSVLVLDIVSRIEIYLKQKANTNLMLKGNELSIDVSDISDELKKTESKRGKGIDYIDSLLNKYY